jgi:hypothetical protein
MICQSLSTEHPHPRLWANHHIVVTIGRFARAVGIGVDPLYSEMVGFGSLTLFCNFSNASCQFQQGSFLRIATAESGISHANAYQKSRIGKRGT